MSASPSYIHPPGVGRRLNEGLNAQGFSMNAWSQRVDTARSPDEVLGVARDYLSSLSPADLVRIPEGCRPAQLDDQSDIDYWNLRLAEELRSIWGTERDGQVLTELAQFFLHASVRLSRVSPPHYGFNVH
jgi:hypothetical protein